MTSVKGEFGMELIFYWVNKDHCIKEQGFCFSPEFTILMEKNENGLYELKISKKEKKNILSSEVIKNVTVLVGENGVGKTTFLKNILTLHCYSLHETNDAEYKEYTKKVNEEYKNLIILRNGQELKLYTNLLKKDLQVTDGIIKNENRFYITDEKTLIPDDYYLFTKIYVSNSCLDNLNGTQSSGTLDDLIITPARLSFVSNAFFEFICPQKIRGEENGFLTYSWLLKQNKFPFDFQQICDLMFYNFLIESDYIKEYEGVVRTQIRIKIQSAFDIIDNINEIAQRNGMDMDEGNINTLSNIKEIADELRKNFSEEKAREDIIYILKTNLILEWYIFDNKLKEIKDSSIEILYSEIVKDIEYENNEYFKEAIKEIRDFENIIKNIPQADNVVPKNNSGYITGNEIPKYTKKNISEADEWKEVISYIDNRAKLNKKINTNEKKYGSFLLRYLRVENLVFSSGERAFQNLMSWIYYLGNLDEYVTRKQDQARENIIVCIDEIDLCMHPAWQRDLIWNVINLVNSCYKGKHIQIIMTTHSPLCLSDVPRDNIIYMKKTEEGTFIDDSEHKETFGANIYEILDDAFYLENKSMGSFALNFIKNLIAEIDQRSEVSDKEYDEYKQKICYIGDSLIRNKLKAKLKSKRRVNKEVEIAEIDKKIDELNKRRKMIMEEKYDFIEISEK